MSDNINKENQNISIINRSKLTLTGIASVDSFDENGITVTTVNDECIVVEGSGISVTDVNLENATVEATGNINGVFYCTQQKSVGILARLFGKK